VFEELHEALRSERSQAGNGARRAAHAGVLEGH
jgi:hypothetical protein